MGNVRRELFHRGLLEDVQIGDRFQIGSAEVIVNEPRVPCYKLSLKFGRADMVKRFLASGRTGFYVMVEKEGVVQAGDEIELIARAENSVSVTDVTRLYASKQPDPATLRRAVNLEALSDAWRDCAAAWSRSWIIRSWRHADSRQRTKDEGRCHARPSSSQKYGVRRSILEQRQATFWT